MNNKILSIEEKSEKKTILDNMYGQLHKQDTGIKQAVQYIIAFNEKHIKRKLIFRRIKHIMTIAYITAMSSLFIINAPNIPSYLLLLLLGILLIIVMKLTDILLEGLERRK